jgi:hypothetical protein
MRRFIMLVTAVLLMTVMLVSTAAPSFAVPERVYNGTPVHATVCESPAAASPLIGWSNGTCWVFYLAPTNFF